MTKIHSSVTYIIMEYKLMSVFFLTSLLGKRLSNGVIVCLP